MRNNTIAILAFILIIISVLAIFLGENESPKLLTGFSSANYVHTLWEYNSTDFNPNASINGTWYFQQGFFNVENDGTVDINVNFSANKNAQQFIG